MKTIPEIGVSEWDALVKKTYNRPYSLQQQGGCSGHSIQGIDAPSEASDYERESIPEEVNHSEKGVSFAAWLARNPKQKLSNDDEPESYCLELWWHRNFYPDLQMVVNDLHAKGLLEAGEHTILIDW